MFYVVQFSQGQKGLPQLRLEGCLRQLWSVHLQGSRAVIAPHKYTFSPQRVAGKSPAPSGGDVPRIHTQVSHPTCHYFYERIDHL